MRRIRYQEIAESLRQRIEAGEFDAGQVLPSEASLGQMYRASRVTIRKALERLRADGLVASRQGFGWLVAAEPLTQSLDELVTIERQLAERGLDSEREIVDFSFVDAPARVAPVLGPRVLEVRRVNRADGRPFARVTVWCREDLGVDLSRSQVAHASFYDLLPGRKRAVQTIGAELMSAADAALLDVPVGSAALVVRRITYGLDDGADDGAGGTDGQAILVSEHSFPGHLTEFTAVLEGAREEAGLRLVVEG